LTASASRGFHQPFRRRPRLLSLHLLAISYTRPFFTIPAEPMPRCFRRRKWNQDGIPAARRRRRQDVFPRCVPMIHTIKTTLFYKKPDLQAKLSLFFFGGGLTPAAQLSKRQNTNFLTFVAWRFGVSEFRRGWLFFVAQQRLLPCATNDAALRNKGVIGCARLLAGRRKLQGKKCAPFKREVGTVLVP